MLAGSLIICLDPSPLELSCRSKCKLCLKSWLAYLWFSSFLNPIGRSSLNKQVFDNDFDVVRLPTVNAPSFVSEKQHGYETGASMWIGEINALLPSSFVHCLTNKISN